MVDDNDVNMNMVHGDDCELNSIFSPTPSLLWRDDDDQESTTTSNTCIE